MVHVPKQDHRLQVSRIQAVSRVPWSQALKSTRLVTNWSDIQITDSNMYAKQDICLYNQVWLVASSCQSYVLGKSSSLMEMGYLCNSPKDIFRDISSRGCHAARCRSL